MSAPIRDLGDESLDMTIVRSDGARQSIASMSGGAVARREPTMYELLHFAIAQNLPVESIERFVGMAERMEDRSAAKAFSEAMAAFQAEMQSIKHNKTAKVTTSTGGSFSYTFASLDEMATACAAPLANNGLSYRWDTRVDEKGMLTVEFIVSHAAGHSKTTSFTLPIASDSKAMSAQQKVSSASKFARRLSMESGLGLTTTDTDREPEDEDPTVVSEDQVIALDDMIAEYKANKKRFLAHFGIERIEDLPAVRFDEAMAALKQVAEQRRKEQEKKS